MLRVNFKNAVSDYVAAFELKHNLKLDYWIADQIGTIASFGDYFIDFNDIRLDIDNKTDKNHFFNWYDLSLDLGACGKKGVNYYTYLKYGKEKI